MWSGGRERGREEERRKGQKDRVRMGGMNMGKEGSREEERDGHKEGGREGGVRCLLLCRIYLLLQRVAIFSHHFPGSTKKGP